MWLEQRDCIKAWTPCIILTRSLALLKEGTLEAGIILQQKLTVLQVRKESEYFAFAFTAFSLIR